MALEITTDHKWHPFKYRHEVPAEVLESEFDYQNEDDALDGFFCYRGVWYHLDGFCETGPDELREKGYHAFASDTFFSGIAIQISDDGEQYRVATVICVS